MILIITVSAVLALNFWYLFSARNLMTRLRDNAAPYWEKIGRPDSFSANHGMSILSNLYKAEMTSACIEARIDRLLNRVRILLPAAFIATGSLLLILNSLLSRPGSQGNL
jgi:hypothetical protein